MAAPKPKPKASDDEVRAAIASMSFEEAMRELEAVVDRIESGAVGLEESLSEYERGMMLRDRCAEILARTEQRVAELTPPPRAGGAAGSVD
jgi:exodeoxyribonuclease VII small subunit